MSKRRRHSTISPNLDRDSKKVRDSDEIFEFEIGTLNITPPRSLYENMASFDRQPVKTGSRSSSPGSPSNIHMKSVPESSKGVIGGQDVTVTISDYDVARIATAVRVLIQEDVTLLYDRIHKLEAKLALYEQNDKYNNICITGLKEPQVKRDDDDDRNEEGEEEGEDTVVKPLHEQIEDIATAVGVELLPRDVDKIYRTGKPTPGRNRPVIVKLTNNHTKRQLLRNSLKLRKSKEHNGVYLNDDLTYENRQIAAAARKHIKDGKLVKTWSTNGSIFVLDNLHRKVRIKCVADLDVAIVKAFRDLKHQQKPRKPSPTKSYSSALSASAATPTVSVSTPTDADLESADTAAMDSR